jgi:hypothetical protein
MCYAYDYDGEESNGDRVLVQKCAYTTHIYPGCSRHLEVL